MDQSKKIRVLLLDEQDDCLALLVTRCLQRAGRFEIHCITGAPTHKLRYSMRCKTRFEKMDSPAALLDAVKRYAAKCPIDVVIPMQEEIIARTGKVADELNMFTRLAPLPSPDLCDQIDNKWRFNQLMVSASIKVPRSVFSAGELKSLEEELKSWTGPYMFKPVYGNGGYGIHKYDSAEDVISALNQLPASDREGFVIQEYISGRDVGCNILCKDGEVVAHSIQKSTLAQNRQFTCGLGLEFVHDDAILAIAARFARVSRFSGVANIDLRVDERDGTVYMLEVNPRYWQTLLGSLDAGINIPEIHCMLALGQSVGTCQTMPGTWINYHALSQDIVNIKRVITSPEYSIRTVHFGEFFADPVIESIYILDGIQRYLNNKISKYRNRLKRR